MQFGGGESSEDEDCMLSENFKLFITNMDIERKDPSAEDKYQQSAASARQGEAYCLVKRIEVSDSEGSYELV